MENKVQEQLLTWIDTSLKAISINLEVLRKSEDKETVREIEEKIVDWFFDLDMSIQKTPKIRLDLDYKPDIDYTLIHSEENKNEEKAYIYLSGHKDKKVYIEGDTCYEVSGKVHGVFSFDEAQEFIKSTFSKDWHLPDKDELNLIYNNLKVTGQIQDENWYWSSSSLSYGSSYASEQRFSDGWQNYSPKEMYNCVRAIRSFKMLS